MKNRINTLFENKKNNILSVYFSAGFPELNDTVTIIKELEKNGADLIEIGIPFSDPLADGPVIQRSNHVALQNGMSMKLLFEQLKDIRKKVTIPLILMGNINPVLRYGMENFCKKASETGIDGIILPDMPFDVYLEEYKLLFESNSLHNIALICPETTEERIRKIDKESEGFIYMVAASATTGAKAHIAQEQIDYFERVQKMNLKNPRLIGFGISNKETFERACMYSNGAIIGSAFIKALEQDGTLQERIGRFVKEVK